MTRMLTLVFGLLCALLAVPVRAEDPPKKLTPQERADLEWKYLEAKFDGGLAFQSGKLPEAAKAFEQVLALARRLYPTAEYPDGHPDLATSLNNLAFVYRSQGNVGRAEPLLVETLAVRKQLHKGDHPDVAASMNNLATVSLEGQKFAAAERLFEDALAMRKRLFKGDHPDVATGTRNLAVLYQNLGKLTAAEPLLKDALEMRRKLSGRDHVNVVESLTDLALFHQVRGQLAEAELLYREALVTTERLFKGDHHLKATCASNLATLYSDSGRLADAEPLFRDALAMRKRLFKGNHPDVAASLNNLAVLYQDLGKLTAAEPLNTAALDMYKGLYKRDHPDVAVALNNLAAVYEEQGRPEAAEPLLKDALAMVQRLYKGNHPDIALKLNNLALVSLSLGKTAEAAPLAEEALAMYKALYKGDHPRVAGIVKNLAGLRLGQGRLAEAEALYADSLGMTRRLIATYAAQKSEGEALTLLASQPHSRNGYLTAVRARVLAPGTTYDPAAAYPALWAAKGSVARVFEHRQLRARAASSDPALAGQLDGLAATRRRRADLLLAPATTDAETRRQRDADLKSLDDEIARTGRNLADRLPVVARASRLAATTVDDLRAALPPDAALVDFTRYRVVEPGAAGPKRKTSERYAAFVVTRDRVTWVDLGAADSIESAVAAWRAAITGDPLRKVRPAPAGEVQELGGKVRALVWGKVRKELPAATKTVYVCPDADLCKVPFAALPGDKPGTILLEDFALATVPHAPFLLDKLWSQDERKNPPAGALVVGGVKYDAEAVAPAVATRAGDPLMKPGDKPGWELLPNTAAEAAGVSATALVKKLPVTALKDDKATTGAILTALPKVKYAHFATHGFFADESFRGPFQLDEKDFEVRGGERIGRAANSPLVMTGLVFAGANDPKTPGRGIVTGEALIDLDLSGLHLAVLSACETGLGDVAGGEGVFGLQRAFHYAGATNVVVSLWKVPDESTAALMSLFYRNLWEKNLTPMESLRQAQLEVYHNPQKIPELAKGLRGKFEVVPGGGGEVAVKPGKDGKAPPLLWAAFTLSGPGH